MTRRPQSKRSLSKAKAVACQKVAIEAVGEAAVANVQPAAGPARAVAGRAARSAVRRANRSAGNQRLLAQILGGSFPGETELDPPFDSLARAGLAARIRRAGVPVNPAVIIACTTVQCVLDEMNRVNP